MADKLFQQYVKTVGVPNDAPAAAKKQLGRHEEVGWLCKTSWLRARRFPLLVYSLPLGGDRRVSAVRVSATGVDPVTVATTFWQPGAEAPEYIALGPAPASNNREYRGLLVHTPTFVENYDARAGDWAEFRQAVAGDFRAESDLPADLEARVVSAVLLMEFTEVRMATSDEQKKLVARLPKRKWRPAEREAAERLSMSLAAERNSLFGLRAGIARQPLTVAELRDFGSPAFGAWAGARLDALASDLVLNNITPALPFSGGWALASPTGTCELDGCWSTAPMRAAVEAAPELAAAMRKAEDAAAEMQHPNNVDMVTELRDLVEYAATYRLVTPVSLARVSEDVGMPVSFFLDGNSGVLPHHRADPRLAADPAVAAKFAFEMLHGLAALHRHDIVLLDRHLGNVTLMRVETTDRVQAGRAVEKGVACDGQSAWYTGLDGGAAYAFPNTNTFAVHIDFDLYLAGPGALRDIRERCGVAAYRQALQAQQRLVNLFTYDLGNREIFTVSEGHVDQLVEGIAAGDSAALGKCALMSAAMAAHQLAAAAHLGKKVSAGVQKLLADVWGVMRDAALAALNDNKLAARPIEAAMAKAFAGWAAARSPARNDPAASHYRIDLPLKFRGMPPPGGEAPPVHPPWADPVVIGRVLGRPPEQIAPRAADYEKAWREPSQVDK